MNKVKKSSVILALTLVASLLFFIHGVLNLYSYANSNSDENEEWNVKIATSTKDLSSEDTKELKFEIQDNPNVAKGKFAPGGVAIAKFNLELTGTKYSVDFKIDIMEKLPEGLKLTATIDGEDYKIGETKTFYLNEQNAFDENTGNKQIILTLKWEDTSVGLSSKDHLSVPIKWEAKQHIK